MLKPIAMIVIVTSFIMLTACEQNTKPVENSNIGINTPQSTETKQPNEVSFTAELLINLQSYQDQFTESDLPALQVLEENLTALIEHDHKLFQSRFVNERLADALEPYYGEQFQYKFTDIESIDQDLPNEHQVNITVIGQRLDTTSDTIEDVKMLYAIRPNEQGEWLIYTID